jgi:hypothetical protein
LGVDHLVTRGLLAICVALGIGALTPATALANNEDLRTMLQSQYAAMKAAMSARDNAAIEAILAPDFQGIDISGQSETAKQMIAEVDALKPDPHKASTTTLISVNLLPNEAIVMQRYDMKTIRDALDGSTHNIELVTLSEDTWIDKKGVWLIKRTVTNELSIFRDGKLIVHKVKP